LTKKGQRGGGGRDFRKINQEEVIFSICYRGQFTYFLTPRIFLVNPSEPLIKKWKLQDSKQPGVQIFEIETEANDRMLKAKQLLAEFIKK
jgi:hypothetical protein